MLAARMAAGGTLGRLVAAGGLGVRLDQFRASGFLTDGGGLLPAEYQARAVAEDAAETAEGAATLAECYAAVASLEEQIESLKLTPRREARRVEGEGEPGMVNGQGRHVPFNARLAPAIADMDAAAAARATGARRAAAAQGRRQGRWQRQRSQGRAARASRGTRRASRRRPRCTTPSSRWPLRG
jgi:hypothetical protein